MVGAGAALAALGNFHMYRTVGFAARPLSAPMCQRPARPSGLRLSKIGE